MKIAPKDRPVVLALLAVAFALLLNAGVSFSEGPQKPAAEHSQHDSDSSGPTKEPERISFWQRTVTDPINLFTAVLAILTVALVGTSVWQGTLTRRSIDLGRAEFLATHRPRIRVRWITGPTYLKDSPDVATLKIAISNFGESNATIVEHSMFAGFLDKDGCFCFPFKLDALDKPEIVLQPGETHIFEKHHVGHDSERAWDRVHNGDDFFVVEGEITYADGANLKRTTSFAREMIPETGAFRVFRAISYSGREYED